MRPRAVVVPVALAGMVACAGLALGRIYDGTLLPRLVAGAAAGAVLLNVLARRLPGWAAGPLSVAGLAGYALLAVRVSATAADVPGDLATVAADAARNGIPRLLTALIPVEAQPDTVLVPVVAAWLAGFAGTELAVRGRRTLLGCVAPAACFAAALYVVGPNAAPARGPTLAFAGLAALALAAGGLAAGGRGDSAAGRRADPAGGWADSAGGPTDRPDHRRIRAAGRMGAAASLAAVAALAVAVAPAVADRVDTAPADPRRHVVPPALDVLDENPLARLSGWAVDPEQRLFEVTVDRETRVRLAVLADYDGVTWRVGATYRGAGRALPPDTEAPTGSTAQTERVTQRVTLAGLSGHLLPAVATPTRVDGVRVAYDPGSGTLARPERLVAGLRYQVTSRHPRPDPNLLPGAEVPSGPAVARLLHLAPGMPEEIERLARHLAEGTAAPYQRAAAIEAYLAEHYRLAADAPGGHAYPNLGFFLFGARDAGGQRGTSEQFATAFAVLARSVGLPTRVVVGFPVPAGTTRVTGADALAWPEVLFTGLGWVPFDPLPTSDAEPRPIEEDFRPQPQATTPSPSIAPTVTVSLPAPAAAASAPPRLSRTAAAGWAMAAAGSLGAVLLLAATGFAVAVPLLRRALRRRRLDRGPPPARVAGAWLEVADALRLAGRPAGRHLTASEVAHHATAATGLPRSAHRARRARRVRPAGRPLDDLVVAVNATVFGPDPPGDSSATRARSQAVAYVAELRSRQPWWRRLLWTLHPGPLRWRRTGR